MKLLEESAAQRETQTRQECEDLMERLAAVTRSAEQERSELQAQYQRKLAQTQQDRDREVERLRDLQRYNFTIAIDWFYNNSIMYTELWHLLNNYNKMYWLKSCHLNKIHTKEQKQEETNILMKNIQAKGLIYNNALKPLLGSKEPLLVVHHAH